MSKTIPVEIRPALFIFASTSILLVVAMVFSMMYRDDAAQSEQSAMRAMRIWKNKIDGSRESDKIVDKYEQAYLGLVKKGVVGNEDRLSWFETIQYISESRGMPSVKYSVVSQEKVASPVIKSRYNGLDLYSSVMTLDMKMGHEGDLFALIGGLQDKAKGLFTIDSCDLNQERLKDDARNSIRIDGMKARCKLSWYTIKAAE